jgi:hypothetical protein
VGRNVMIVITMLNCLHLIMKTLRMERFDNVLDAGANMTSKDSLPIDVQ